MAQLILASASPRRLQLLEQISLRPDSVMPADIDETPLKNEQPAAYAKRIALAKAEKIAATEKDAYILAADTVVACGRRILPKAEDEATAAKCLDLLSGKRHRVLGGIAVIAPSGKIRVKLVTTAVKFKNLSPQEKLDYLATGDWDGKAGGYAIQGPAAAFIPFISGSYTNVVGLSLPETRQMLHGLGYKNEE
ncbi:MAG: septum formation protein Maf [Alphaproteobacteria bacterium]|nr:MAG: septum formation protein Maf [Alphaproteobacteria bacterium]